MSLLVAEDLARGYGQVAGLTDLSVTIGPGVTGLIGPNGAGKSTFLKLIVGELKPTRGSLRVLGETPFGNRELYRRIGFAPQQDAFYEHLDAVGMVRLLLRLAGYSRREATERAASALDRVRLVEGRERPIKTYSKGMRQRVKLAQAIAHDPELLVLDEPLTGLDPLGRRDVLRLLQGLADEGKTIVVSSHVLHEVESLTQEILLLHRGRLLAQGRVREVRKLLDQYPSRVAIRARRARDLGRVLMGFDEVRACRLGHGDDALELETVDLDSFLNRMAGVCASESFGVSVMKSMDENLEAVFDYLVE